MVQAKEVLKTREDPASVKEAAYKQAEKLLSKVPKLTKEEDEVSRAQGDIEATLQALSALKKCKLGLKNISKDNGRALLKECMAEYHDLTKDKHENSKCMVLRRPNGRFVFGSSIFS